MFVWLGKEICTLGDLSHAISNVSSKNEAAALLKVYASSIHETNIEEKFNAVLENVRYIAGYYEPETRSKILELFRFE